jgi:hypothetical protein
MFEAVTIAIVDLDALGKGSVCPRAESRQMHGEYLMHFVFVHGGFLIER